MTDTLPALLPSKRASTLGALLDQRRLNARCSPSRASSPDSECQHQSPATPAYKAMPPYMLAPMTLPSPSIDLLRDSSGCRNSTPSPTPGIQRQHLTPPVDSKFPSGIGVNSNSQAGHLAIREQLVSKGGHIGREIPISAFWLSV